MNSLHLVLCFVTISQILADDQPTSDIGKLYVSLASGVFSDTPIWEKYEDASSSTAYAVNLKLGDSDFVVYWEVYKNNKLYLQEIDTIKGQGETALVQKYKFKEPEKFVPGQFSSSDLESLTLDDLKTKEECQGTLKAQKGPRVVISWTGCLNDISEVSETSLSCLTLEVSLGSDRSTQYKQIKIKNWDVPNNIIPDYDQYKALCNNE